MRKLFLVLLLAPLMMWGQINRSANEVAKEVTKDWLMKKLFKGKEYQPVWFSELKPFNDKESGSAWTIEHHFDIIDKSGYERPSNTKTSYSFQFFLDKRMKVLRAESYSRR